MFLSHSKGGGGVAVNISQGSHLEKMFSIFQIRITSMFATMKTLQVKVNLLKNKKINNSNHSRKNTEMKILKALSLSRQGENLAAENV